MKQPSFSRRDFIQQSALATAAVIGTPQLVRAANVLDPVNPGVRTGAVILFQGDSITDAGRSRANYYANDGSGMGGGYVYQTVTQLLGQNPAKQLRCYNRGVSGNKVYQLDARWDDDCLQLKPDVLSILIGVNDFWHTLDFNYKGTAQTFEQDFRKLLDRTKNALPEVRLIIGEPFAVKGGTAITSKWYPDFKGYQDAARRIAQDYKAMFIPYQSVFDKALEQAPASYWCPDGVHPSLAGVYLMAQAWMAAWEVVK